MRKRAWLLGCSGCLILTVGALAAVTIFVFCNPFLLAFLTTFRVANESGEDLRITPIGMWEGSGRYGPLPMYRNASPPAWPRKGHGLRLPAGKSISITYDWDDINFRHILVKGRGDRILILDTDRMGTLTGCCPPAKERYVIPKLKELRPAPKELVPCFRGKDVAYSGAKEYPVGEDS
jgi:hypothetical protein